MKSIADMESEIFEGTANVEELLAHPDWKLRMLAVLEGVSPEQFKNDPNWVVRAEVAKQGFGLETLILDESPFVRWEVAKQNYGAEVLIEDKHPYVRKAALESLKLAERTLNMGGMDL